MREGDKFFAGVTVTVHDASIQGDIEIEVMRVCELLELHAPAIKVAIIFIP